MATLGSRIKNLREKQDIKQIDFAKKIGVSNVVLSRYESDERKPDYDTLQTIADFFEVTTDYLLGRTDIPNPANYKKAGISDDDYNSLSAYQKEVIDFFVSREKLAFKNQPENILEALEEFEIFYEYYKKKQEDKK